MDQARQAAKPDDPRVKAALAEYMEKVDRGEQVDREQFLAAHADIADELGSFITTSEELARLASPARKESEAQSISTRSLAERDQETLIPQRVKGDVKETQALGLPPQFGRYKILKPLGSGAMGTVYLAEDSQLHRKVAIKTPSFEQDDTGELLERFYREARSAATIRHPHICPVFDVGEIGGKHFITMAWIEGRPLSAYIRPDKLQAERQTLVAVRKLALALQEAHDHNIIHRDLKPGNIMIDGKGEPIVMDFGLARKVHREDASRLTQSGMIVGSPAYMSPEQVEGDPDKLGPAADQYSLGVILYELLTGQLPFRGSVTAVIGAILTKEPTPVAELRKGIDPRIAALCQRMMAKQARDRFPSMKGVAETIAGILKEAPGEAMKETVQVGTRASRAVEGPAKPQATQGAKVEKGLEAAAAVSITASNVTSLFEAAQKCMRKYDYEQVVQMLQQIPEQKRTDEVRALLTKARQLADEVSFLLAEIDEAERVNDNAVLTRATDELLKLKPKHHKALQIKDELSRYGTGKLWKPGGYTPDGRRIGEGSWIPWLGIAVGVIAFAATLWAVTIYLKAGDAVVRVQINDPDVKVSFQGRTLNIQSANKEFKVEPGENTLQITYGDSEFETEKFTLKDGENPAVVVELLDKTLAAKFGEESIGEWDVNQSGERAVPPPVPTPAPGPTGVVLDSTSADGDDWIDLLADGIGSWRGRKDLWSYSNGVLTGKPSGGTGNTFLFSPRTYGDFELKFQFHIADNVNTGVQIRSEIADDNQWSARGPQCDIGNRANDFTGGLYGELLQGGWLLKPSLAAPIRSNDWNDYFVRCAGRRVRIDVNGTRVVDGDVPQMADEGLIAFQIHAGNASDVRFQNVLIRELQSTSPTPASPASPVPADAVAFQGHSYKYFGEKLTWKEARQRCEQMGGHLAIVETAAENAFLNNMADKGFPNAGRNGFESVWLGATDEVKEGEWRWIDGSRVAYTNWQGNQPNNKQNQEHYALLWLSRDPNRVSGQWSDQPNDSVQHIAHFICEWDELRSAAPAQAGWTDLFNGRDLTGWDVMESSGSSAVDQSQHRKSSGGWEARNGVLVCTTNKPGWLKTQREYGDFVLQLDFKVPRNGNSGIYVRTPEQGHSSRVGMEVQVIDEDRLDRSVPNPDWTGSIHKAAQASSSAMNPVGQWNSMEIECRGDDVTVTLNGSRVVQTNMQSSNALRVRPRRGYIGLANWMGEAAGTEFRNVRIRELSGGDGAQSAPAIAWTDLFNGTDLTGWKGLVGDPVKRSQMSAAELAAAQATADQQMRQHWKVVDGVLEFDGQGDSLCTERDYGDFELSLDWKIPPGGDSGIYLRGCPQVQIWDTGSGKPDADKGSGGLYNNKSNPRQPNVKADNPVGEWNTFFIRMVGDRVTVDLNGRRVVDNVVMENLFAPGQPMYPTGPIELQKHTGRLWFRNIRIRELSRATPPAAGNAANTPRAAEPLPGNEWISLDPSAPRVTSWNWGKPLRNPENKKWENGVLSLDNAAVAFNQVQARDVSFRAKVRFLEGNNMALVVRGEHGKGGVYALFDKQNNGQMYVAFLNTNKSKVLALKDDYFDFQVDAIGDQVTIQVNGQTVVRHRETEKLKAGHIEVTAYNARGMFKEMAVKILDEAPPTAAAQNGSNDLFNGQDLTGWVRHTNGQAVTSGWTVENGEIHLRPPGGGDIRSTATYGDFELEFEWKVAPGANSGIFYRAGATPQSGAGPEYQVVDDQRTNDGKQAHTSAGSIYNIAGSTNKSLNPAGQWNQARIITRGNHVEHWLNGSKVAEAEIGSPQWNQAVAQSYLAQRPQFAKASTGHIVLQDHGGEAWFRNLRIRELSAEAASASTAPAANDWVELFNGRNLTGWTAPVLPNNWEIRNGVIAGKGTGLSALFANDTYDNFELDLEYKLAAGSNSGIWFRAPNNAEAAFGGAKTAMSISLVDDASPVWAKDIQDPTKRTGGLHAAAGPNPLPSAPAGAWNQLRLRAVGPQIALTINGTQVLDVNTADHVGRLTEYTGLTRTSGYIGLEDHGEDGVEFRNIRIRKLSGDSASTGPATDGWTDLVNGRDLTGWQPMETLGGGGDQHRPTTGGWEARNGELICTTDQPGWLKSAAQYGEFEFETEFKVPAGGNSDIYIRCPGSGRLSRTGMAIQIIDEHSGKFTMDPTNRPGAIWGVVGHDIAPVTRPLGEWNSLSIRCEGDRVQVSINGQQTVDANMQAVPELRDRPRSGFIGLANWGGEAKGIAFRNMRIRDRSSGKEDTAALQGTWTAVGQEIAGGVWTQEQIAEHEKSLTFAGDTFEIRYLDRMGQFQVERGTYRLDRTHDPAHITMNGTNRDGRDFEFLGIYQLEGDQLRHCFVKTSDDRTAVRPTSFSTSAGSGQFSTTYRRD